MFTVKVLRPSMVAKATDGIDGRDEQIYEAREVTKDERGILLQTEGDTLLIAQTGYLRSLDSLTNCGEVGPGKAQSNNVSIYVMNRFGATVATYQF